MSVTVAIVDDHPVVRAGLRAVLEADPDIEITAEAASVRDALDRLATSPVDVALVDLHLGAGGDGLELVAALHGSPTRTLVVTAFDTERDVVAALAAGAVGYLLKDAPEAELLAAVHAAARGDTVLGGPAAARLVAASLDDPGRLTERELEVLEAVADGLDNAAVARRLFVSQATVKTHLNHVFSKLGVTNRTAAVSEARRRGLLR